MRRTLTALTIAVGLMSMLFVSAPVASAGPDDPVPPPGTM